MAKKIDTQFVITNLKDTPIKHEDGSVLTLGEVVAESLISDKTVTGKMKIFTLAERFYKEKGFDLDDADLALVKKCVEVSTYNNVIIGRVLVELSK